MSPKVLRFLGIWTFGVDLIVGLLMIFFTVRHVPLSFGSSPFPGSNQEDVVYSYSNPYAPYGFLIILIGVAFLVGLHMLARRIEKSKSKR